jgi:hypothetical protein
MKLEKEFRDSRISPIGPEKPGFCQTKRNREEYQDWLAVDAVQCELFSGPNSLLTGKNTGSLGPWSELAWHNSTLQTVLARKLPFSGQSEQGRIREGTGDGIPC